MSDTQRSAEVHDLATDPDFTAFLEPFVTEHKRELFDRVLGERTRWVTIVLEEIHQGHNASACMRTCDGFGVQDVHVVEKRNEFQPDAQIALGASQWLSVRRHDSILDCYAALREAGYRIVATSPHDGLGGESGQLAEIDVRTPIALVFGTELRGLTDVAVAGADETLRVPMHGFTESLNVSVTAALCLWHATNRIRAVDVDWRLPADERAAVRAEWIRSAIGWRLPAYEDRWRERHAPGSEWITKGDA